MNKTAIEKMKKVKHKILVMSGKGGVGKTTVTVNIAFALAKKGFKVGIMDVDIHGPNVPLMTGTEGTRVQGSEGNILPVVSPVDDKVKVLSISAFLDNPDSPIIWRGPRKIGVINQFMGEGNWSDVDVLLIDCPPGTGDEPLSVAQNIPDADGAIVVTSPQEVALLDSRKSVNFLKQLNLNVLGIVENMSGFTCPHCNQVVDIFKRDGGKKASEQLEVNFLGQIPLNLKVVESGDEGKPVVITDPDNPASKVFSEITDEISRDWHLE
ncbi:MAG: Mrp/NBP35 family ATP-binding protein [Myxococcota bacterium]